MQKNIPRSLASKTPRKPRPVFPHTPIRGGDCPRGGRRSGPGHAGKGRLAAFATTFCLIAALATLLIAKPQTAQAYSGNMTWTYNGVHLISNMVGSDGSRGYCAEAEKMGPSQPYSEWYWIGEVDRETLHADPHGLAWLISQCYPFHSSFYGQDLSSDEAVHVSQAAIWMYQGTMNQDHYIPARKTTCTSCTEAEAAIAWKLAQEAKGHEGQEGPWDHCAKYWIAPSSSLQNMIGIPPTGSIIFSKQSAAPELTVSAPGYSLEGASFGLYTDEACTQELQSFTVDAEGKAQIDDIGAGTYYLKEKAAPSGYLLDSDPISVTVTAGSTTEASIAETPRYGVPDILIEKQDSATGTATPQGDASLEGAEFTASFYSAGTKAEAGKPERTWVLKTDSDGMVRMDDAHKVSGDDWYQIGDGTVVLPLGTLVLEETRAPEGYELPHDAKTIFTISPDSSSSTGASVLNPATVSEDVIRGGLSVQKLDAERKDATPLGNATLAGAVFTITNAGAQSVVVDGKTYAPGDAVLTIEADASGKASTAADALPYGTYRVDETTAPKGYQLNSSWSGTVKISEAGKMATLEEGEACQDYVIRGDLSFVKQDAETAGRMKGVPFRIVSKTTGEWHIAMTDENGLLDTSASHQPHTQDANANDKALQDDGSVDDSLIDPTAGIWFSGSADTAVPADDSMGALPYDTYRIEELPSSANQGKKLVSFEATVSRNSFVVGLGTVSNENGPHIGTTLTSEEGEHVVASTSELFTLIDTVSYSNLTPGTTYELTGTLMDHDTGEPLAGAEPVTVSFVPDAESGTQEVSFMIQGLPETVKRIVAFESLKEEGKEIAVHADIEDEGQSVRFSELHTTATSRKDGTHSIQAGDGAEIVDTVTYAGLVPQETYTLEATLHVVDGNGNDGGALLNEGGDVIAFTKDFVPESEDGTVDVPISFNASSLGGRKIVVFERLTHRSHEVGKHEDIHDEGQTIEFTQPGIPDTGDAGSLLWIAFGSAGILILAGGLVLRSHH